MKNLTVSDYLHFLEVEKEIYIGWNRFYPSIFILNRSALTLLDHIKAKKPLPESQQVRDFLRELMKYRFIYGGDTDTSGNDFIDMVQQKLAESDRRAADFYRLKQDYSVLKIVNDRCNLSCSYCVAENGSGNSHHCTGPTVTHQGNLRIIQRLIHQFFSRKISNGINDTRISFNGGEILVDWKTIKKILPWIARKYPRIKTSYLMNTNLTLVTEEIARFLDQYHFKVFISIDGYGEAHDRTRIYHNGKGSFADVIQRVALCREYPNISGLDVYQGTIAYPENFQAGEVYKMADYGFVKARLAPNLLGRSEEEALKNARLMGEFLELNTRHPFQVTELIFTRAKNKINQQEYQFSFNCPGLSALPRLNIEINLTTRAVSHLCGFIEGAAVPIEVLGNDIYNPKLWEVSYRFLKERMDTMFNHCMDCSLVGICVGGCILSGIDRHNRINRAACVYQQEMWKIYVEKAYRDRKKKKS